jgi:hypothetical protein
LRPNLSDTRIVSRAMATLGEVHRRLGNREEAAHMLERAMREQAVHEFLGDQAGLSWTCLAKLQAGSESAGQFLARAKAAQLDLRDRVGEARTLLLEARLADDADSIEHVKRRILDLKDLVPALSQCRLLARVLDHWNQWVGNLEPDETGDIFWGV